MINKREFQSLLFHELAQESDVKKIVSSIKKQHLKVEKRHPLYSLPECLVGSVFSINVRPKTWRNVIENMNDYSGWGDIPTNERNLISLSELVELSSRVLTFERKIFRNHQRTSTRSGITKADATIKFANILINEEIEDFSDLHPEKLLRCFAKIRQIPGQQSGVTLVFMLMLAGWKDLVKPDRRIQGYCEQQLGKNMRPTYCAELIRQAAYQLKLVPSCLDKAIFRKETRN